MSKSQTEIVAFLDWSRDLIEPFRATRTPGQRAELLARGVQHLLASPLAVCLLRGGGEPALCAVDGTGRTRPPWAKFLRGPLSDWAAQGAAGGGNFPAALPDPELAGHALHGVRVGFDEQSYGALALALPQEMSADNLAACRAQLAWAAREVALWLRLEERDRETRSMRDEHQWQANLVGVADLAEVGTHELNNILNNVLLHLSILERSAIPNELRDQTASIRRKAMSDVDLVRTLQKFGESRQPPLQPIDLNQVVRDTVVGLSSEGGDASGQEFLIYPLEGGGNGGRGVKLRVELAGDLAPVLGSYFDLKHLLKLLLTNAAAAMASSPGSITVRTVRLDHRVQLRVEDAGPSVSPQRVFELFTEARPGDDGVRLNTCKVVARRLQATVLVENRPEGGIACVVELRAAKPPQGTS